MGNGEQLAEIVTLKFETMAQGGEGLAREENGRVVFVPYAITGETARVEIVEAKRGFARGRILEILDASPARITPRCPHFQRRCRSRGGKRSRPGQDPGG